MHGQPDGPSKICLVIIDQEPRKEILKTCRLSFFKAYAGDSVAHRRTSVPRAAKRHKGISPVFFRKLGAGIKLHFQRRSMRRVQKAGQGCLLQVFLISRSPFWPLNRVVFAIAKYVWPAV